MKNFLLFNQSFGTVGSPNQTGETQTRENRIGLMSYLRRALMLLFAVLVMSIANIGMAWGAGTTAKTISEGDQYFSAYTEAKTNLSSNNWVNTSGSPGNNASSYTAPSGWLDGGSGKPGVGFMTVQSGKTVIFTVTNITGVSILGCSNNTSSRTINLSVKTGGVEVGTVATKTTSSTSTPEVLTYGSTLDKTKTYTVTVSASSGNNAKFMQIKFVGASAASTKRIYMKAGAWNSDSPKFYVHSWLDSDNNTEEMALADCETDVYYADIPSTHTGLLFTRQNSTSTGINWDYNDKLWNQSEDITIGSNDKFTFSSWGTGDGHPKSSFSGGTYSAPTYTISFAGNDNTGGSMSNISSIACEADQTVTANAYTKTGHSFTGWKADVDVKVGGETKTAGTLLADGVTIQDISSNITLTAQWEEVVTLYTVTYNVNGGGSVTPTSATQASSGASVTLPTPTWSGYTFDGWYNTGTKIGNGAASYTPTADITLYAHWTDNISGKVFSFIDNNYGDKFKAFDLSGLVTGNATGKSKTYTNGDGVQYNVSAGCWDSKSNAISSLAKFKGGTSTMSVVIPTGKIATVKISYNAYGTGDGYRLTVNSTAQANPSTKLTDVMTNAEVISSMKEITLNNQTGTLTLGISDASKNNYIGRVSAVITGYVVTYAKGSADGATGDSFTETKTAGSSFTLSSSSSAFTRSGYVYDGWSVNANGSTKDYNLGGSYTTDAAITLYPHWVADCVAPTSVNITGTYHYFPGETISLTAAAEGGSGTSTTYQWYKGGTADGNIIEGATSATYNKAKCTYADAGSYYCKVTRGGSCSTFSGNYDVKILHLYVNTGRNGTAYGDVDFVKVDATTARATISLGANWDYGFNIADGCGHYYGNTGSMNESNCTDWTMNVDGTDCLMRTTNGATYTFTVDYTTLTAPVVSITYPSANQAADKVIYFDNNDRNWSTLHYRIGRTNHTQATAMTQVLGTANLYKVNTAAYDNFSGWHIANNAGWTGVNNSIYRTYTNDDEYSITYATAHEGGAVTESAVTVTPTDSRGMGGDAGINNNCEFYNYEITNGMKTQNVSITAPSNGTIRVDYTDVEGASQSFTSGNRDLAHTVIITPTATPAEGYTLSGLTVNGDAHTSGNTYTVTANTTIAATFSPIQVSSISVAPSSKTLEVGGTQQLTATASPDNALDKTVTWSTSNGSVATVSSTGLVTAVAAGTCTITATAHDGSGKTGTCAITVTAAASQTALVINTLYEVPDMIPSGKSLTSSDQFFDGLSANTKFELIGSGSGSTTPKVNNNSSNDKTIDGIPFDDGSMWFKGEASLTSNIPTKFGLSFIVPEGGGKLYLYFSGTSTNIKLAKSGEAGSKPSCPNGYGAVDVTAGTYYLYGTGTTAPYCFYGLKLCSKYSVSITTTNTTKVTGEATAVHGKAYTATFTAPVGYTLPSDVTSLTIGGVAQTKGTGYTWTISDGTATLTVPADKVTGNIVVTVTGTAAATYSITYYCDDAESGCPSNVAAATNLPNPLPSAPTKDGYDFVGWYTNSTKTVAAVAGAALSENTTLYAKWTERGSECEDTPHAWNVIATGAKSYKVRISKVTEEVAIPVADATASNLTAYAGSVSTNDNVTVQIADGGSSQYGYKFDGSNTYLKLVFSTPLVLNDTLVVGMTDASKNISFTTTAVRATTHSTSGGKLIIPAALAGQSTLYLWRGSGNTMYLRSFAVKHKCDALTPCTTPVIPALSNQSLCEGADIAPWNATVTNASAISAAGETVTYSWKKKGNATELANTASFDLGASAAESQAGTYVVTVTVSKTGYASSSASREVDLSVTEGTEAPTVTQSTTPVYEGNSVTLTATATTGATYTWHTCNADGTGESSAISGATTNAYTIASAPAAGTHYYKVKVTGDGTHTCGNAETVYALTVSEAAGGDCETEFWFAKAADKPEGATAATHITGTPSGSSSASYTATIDGNNYTITGQTGQKTGNVTITVPEDYEGTLYVVVQGSSSRTITLSKGGVQVGQETPANSTWGTFTFSNLDAGTYTLVSSGNIGWGILALKLCSAVACTDPEVTASADNTTACVGTSVTFTAANAHASATYQWQKYSGGAWTDIADANASTYTIPSVATTDALKYRVIATNACDRTSNEVTLSVPSAPNFGSTVPTSVSVMQTIALSINTVEATDATKYRWYKSADATWDAGDVEIGTNKELIKAYDGEAIGSPSYYIFCRAQNACGITTSTAIEVNVTAYVEEDCATRGNEGDAEFGFENSGCGQGTYNSASCWTMNSNSKKLVYAAPDGKYFKTMKVTIASSSVSKASYNWSTNGGTTYTGVAITGLTTTLTEKTIDLSAQGNVNSIQIGRNFDDKGEGSGTLYVSKICFEYTDACAATTVTPSETSKTYEMDGSSFTEPTFTVKHGGTAFDPQPTLSYSSSNEDIASVDDDGTVTFNGEAGTVTITASYAGGTISATEYCASSGSYTINVSCPGGAPKVVASGTTVECSSSITLQAKTQAGGDFADGTYQWFRNGEEIDGATSSSYTATQAGTYTVERTNTSDCTTPSTNSAVVTSETTEPEVERLVPFQYYHVDKTYSDQMKMRHLFAVKNSGKLDGKSFKMYVSRNGGAAADVTSSNALVVVPNGDGHVDTVMVDLNRLNGKYSEDDELVFTCKAIDCSKNVSDVYKETITMNVIGATPTLALICSGTDIAAGTRETKKLTVGGDFLTGYNKADLCQQTGGTSFDANTEWGLYTDLKANYIVTPVNGYAVFNKLNYEPFDILLLTDYPKASKSDAAKDVLDDMAALCDYRPMLSFKTHMVAKSPSKWAAKGFTTSATENKADGKLNLNIVCYAHPMFESIKTGENVYDDVANSSAPLVYTMLTGEGYEGKKGMQGFELAAAENFVTIGLTHYNATIAKDGSTATWTPGTEDRMLVTVAERQTNIEARFILFSLNCGAQSMLTEKGRTVILKCLEYLLETDPLKVADCSFTFDNGKSNEHDASWYSSNCSSCTGTKGDGKWSTAANWGPDYRLLPGEFTSARIAAPVTVDMDHAKAMELRIIDEGRIDIPANKALDVKSTIRRMDGSEIYPTEESDIHIGSGASGNGTLIFNNNSGDTKARVDMYSNALADVEHMSAATSTWQYIGTPHNDIANAQSNYYDSWLYQYSGSGWEVIPNGGPLVPFRGYCVTHPDAPVVFGMEGTLVATTSQDIAIPAGYTVIANSWVAPIDINAITDDDMEGISDKSIYFFNTGSDADRSGGIGTEAGTYRTTPIHSASYTGDWQIPSMQGFYISTTSAGTLHLDYDRHVRPTGSRSVVSNPMYAPRRAAAESDEPNVLKIFARGSRYQDKLVVLEREDFTRGYDSGWDGEAWGGGTLSPMVYVTGEGREDAVSAIPEFEGTVIAFKAGEDNEYTIDFEYNSEEPLYLLDTENNTYTQIMTGNAYYFTTSDKSKHARFILTRKSPQITTGVGNVSGDEVQGTKAKKLLIEDKMFIMVNGVLYDATGKVVK